MPTRSLWPLILVLRADSQHWQAPSSLYGVRIVDRQLLVRGPRHSQVEKFYCTRTDKLPEDMRIADEPYKIKEL